MVHSWKVQFSYCTQLQSTVQLCYLALKFSSTVVWYLAVIIRIKFNYNEKVLFFSGICFLVTNGYQKVKEKKNYKKHCMLAVTRISHFLHHLYYFKIILNDKLSTITYGYQSVLQNRRYLYLLEWKDFLCVCLFSS